MLLEIHPQNPQERQIEHVIRILQNEGIIIYPTDTVYGLGCDIFCSKAIERIARLKGIKPEKALFSFICYDLSHITDFTRPLDNWVFKLMKKNLPGPFTFILNANNNVPRLLKSPKKTVGIRVPENNIAREIVRLLGHPIVSTSIHDIDKLIEYTTDAGLIHDEYEKLVDLVIDGGYGKNIPSTVVDCTGNEPLILRQGIGELVY
jgi:tRNA threonylcarbamoyl adenosine modification protein (Sua5/YciO/YrdC/YwlC family)